MEGIILINKPPGPTSHDIVSILRRVTGIRKIGYAGTLDPFAEGLLICLIGRSATKRSDQFLKLDKEYIATLKLGQETDTYDLEGKVTSDKKEEIDFKRLKKEIPEVLKSFKGQIMQEPPMFSAKKVKGKKLYELARKGIEIKREKVPVEIKEIELLDIKDKDYPEVTIRVSCSSGTYIRSLAFDIGKKLDIGAHLTKLSRTKIGIYNLKNAISLKELTLESIKKHLILVDDLEKR